MKYSIAAFAAILATLSLGAHARAASEKILSSTTSVDTSIAT